MTYIAFIVGGLIFSSALGKLLKRNLEANYPRCDDEGEIEALLAGGLELALAKEVRS